MGPTLYQIAYCYISTSQHLAMDELFEIWKQVTKKKKTMTAIINSVKRKQKINLANMSKVVIFLPSVRLLYPSFTIEALNTAAIYGSLNSALSYVLKL